MKILYIGTVSENQEYEKILAESRVKASSAPHVFETTLAKGMIENGIGEEDIEFLAFPMIAAFPGSKKLCWGARKQRLLDKYSLTWIPAVNIHGLKMFSQRQSSKKMIKRWLNENREIEDKCVLMYSIYQPVASNVISLCRKYGCKCYAFVPDLPKHMYLSKSGIRGMLAARYVKKAVKIQGNFDGYIYLTEAMRDEISPEKPYIVVEGIADRAITEVKAGERKKNVIMYAGALSKRYGFPNLVKAFSMLEGDYELHIYGYGDYVPDLEAHSKNDPRIKYFGRVSRDEILVKEKEASLLINVRNSDDEFTKYSFPSKTMEYMLSGTPLLTTKLPGIPEEYFEHCIGLQNNEPSEIKVAIEEFFALEEVERRGIGASAAEFISTEKNQSVQAKRVLDFLRSELRSKK